MIEGGIDRGIILKIAVEDFVTYKKVVVKPGRGLNVIIGPNGTGKSTILAAILIGLGGNPAVLGKKNKVADFIKAGCTKAKIEIVLSDTKKKTVSLGRIFDAHHSTYYINGGQANQSKFQDVVESFNIQLDNLCQFLPQEKVQDFSKMNPQELLINTEKSVAGELYENHQNLIKKRDDQRDVEEKLKTMQSVLDNDKNRFENLAVTVGSIKERKAAKKKVITIEQKLAWMIYNESRVRLEDAKKKHEEAINRKNVLAEQLIPIDKVIQTLSTEIQTMNSTIHNYDSKITINNQQCQELLLKIDQIRNSIKNAEQRCNELIETEKTRDYDIAQANLRKVKVENDIKLVIEEIGSFDSLTAADNELKKLMDSQRLVVNSFKTKIDDLKGQSEFVRREIVALTREQQAIQDVASKKLMILKAKNPDAYQGVMWLRQNIHQFKGVVHEPMMMSIQPINERYAKYFESRISPRDLFAFVCENVDDMKHLLHCLRDEQHLTVNVIHSDPLTQVNRTPQVPLEYLKVFGFENYLVSLVDAPNTIMNILLSMYQIHNVPIGTDQVSKKLDELPDKLRCFFTPTTFFNIRYSKYSDQKSTSYNPIATNGLLSTIVDNQKIKDIENTLTKKSKELLETMEKLSENENQFREESEKMENLIDKKKIVKKNLNHLLSLNRRLEVEARRAANFEEGRKSPELIKAETSKQIQIYISQQLKFFDKINSLFSDSAKIIIKSEKSNFEVKMKTKMLKLHKNESKDLRDQYDNANGVATEMAKNLRPFRDKAFDLLDAAKKLTGGFSPNDRKIFKKYQDAFAKYPDTRDELERQLDREKAQVHCLDSHQNAEQVLKDYEAMEKKIAELNEKMQKLQDELEVNSREIEELKDKWLIPLEALVGRINVNFSKHFRDMRCAGEVSLDRGENQQEYQNYGLKIRVKFRAADDLHEFTRNRQSGGERAVTTGIFMISIQELSRVPFRCVDELNQGMDATNEKMVFDLITKITAVQGSSQYFLLTPKLLPNLQYGRHVTVHCVFNGPFVVPHNEFSIKDFCDSLSKSL